MVEIVLPRPPSINRLWRIGKGRMFKSQEYNAWLDECELIVRRMKLPKITGHYKIMVRALRPDKRRRDIDNIGSKAIQDLLQRAGVIEDDCLCDAVYCRWVTSGPPVRINIYPVPGENHVIRGRTKGSLQSC